MKTTSINSSRKPRSEQNRPELTRLPQLTLWRRALRRILHGFARLLVWLFLSVEVRGLDDFPPEGPALVVANHLGDADVPLGLAYTPRFVELMAKIELFDLPVLGKVMDTYGVIWVHRGQPDRRALRAALDGLAEGRVIAIAPEGRESVTGGLEEGTGGAAFLALKASVPIIPVTMTGTENATFYGNLKRLRRTRVTLTIGPSFYLEKQSGRQTAIQRGTQTIMYALAMQLPPEYRGVYQIQSEHIHGGQ